MACHLARFPHIPWANSPLQMFLICIYGDGAGFMTAERIASTISLMHLQNPSDHSTQPGKVGKVAQHMKLCNPPQIQIWNLYVHTPENCKVKNRSRVMSLKSLAE